MEELLAVSESYINDNLKETRKQHTLRVVDEALRLAEKYNADLDKVKIASLLHDMAKNLNDEDMNILIDKYHLSSRYRGNANLAHGKLAAVMLPDIFGITDEEIINAVSFHTTGREGMSIVEKIVFLADAIEPNRTFPGVDEIRSIAENDLDDACLMMLERTVEYISHKGIYLDPDTLNARDYFIKQKENK